MDSLEFFIYEFMSSENSDNVPDSFPRWISFISFSCLNVLSGISSTILNKSGKSWPPCLVSDLIGKALLWTLCELWGYHL